MKKAAKKSNKKAATKKAKKPKATSAKASKKVPKLAKTKEKVLKKVSAKVIPAKAQVKAKTKEVKTPVPVAAPEPLAKSAKNKKAQAIVLEALAQDEKEVILTNADGKQYCRVHDCDSEGSTDGYCRFHYLALWKRNKIKAKILQGDKLDKYIEELTAKYPDKYLEILRKDLASEKDFTLIINEMDVEDSNEDAESEEEASRFIEEVRGGVPTGDDDDGGY
ncbi:MAG: hypothetical protein SGI74_12420 [Oligoflexia bacterium]|nr:hypothetical protein [Oligoflexia bacterium]